MDNSAVIDSMMSPSLGNRIVSRSAVSRGLIYFAWFFGFVAIFASTYYLCGFGHWAIIYPWQFPFWATVPFFLTGLCLFLAVAIQPKYLWPIMIGMAVPTSGVFVLRFPIFDDWLTGCIAAGAIVAVLTGQVKRRDFRAHRVWVWTFLVFVVHLTLMSIAGFYLYNNPKATRFLFLFASITCFAVMNSFFEFPAVSSSDMTLLIGWTGSIFCLTYLIHGWVFHEHVYTVILEGIGFATSGYQTAPLIVLVPAGLLLFEKGKPLYRVWGLIILFLSLMVSALTDSRGGMLSITAGLAMLPFAFGFRKTLQYVLPFLIAAVLVGVLSYGRIDWIVDQADSLARGLNYSKGSWTYQYFGRKVKTAKGDSGRYLYARTGFRFLACEFPFPAITGAGIYGYFPKARKYYDELAKETGIDPTSVNHGAPILGYRINEPSRPPAAGAFLVETGIIGAVSMGICFLFSFWNALFRVSGGRILLQRGNNMMVVSALISIIGFLYFSELQDMVLFYLLIMPYGLMHAWSRA